MKRLIRNGDIVKWEGDNGHSLCGAVMHGGTDVGNQRVLIGGKWKKILVWPRRCTPISNKMEVVLDKKEIEIMFADKSTDGRFA